MLVTLGLYLMSTTVIFAGTWHRPVFVNEGETTSFWKAGEVVVRLIAAAVFVAGYHLFITGGVR